MQHFIHTQMGTFHQNHNEDNFVFATLGNNKILLAVMDGCSMGTESHFASNLIAKVLRKLAKEFFYKDFLEKEDTDMEKQLKAIVKLLFEQLIQLKNILGLEQNELLSTMVISIIDTKSGEGEVLVVGDGFVAVNGRWIEYDQDNIPDYLGYHLSEDFEAWFSEQQQRLSLDRIQDISIGTDGIFTFRKFDNQNYPLISEREIINLLIFDCNGIDKEQMFLKKLLFIEKENGLRPTDDLTIIRLLL